MRKNIKIIVLSGIFVLLLAGAAIAYQVLKPQFESSGLQNATQSQSSSSTASSTASTADSSSAGSQPEKVKAPDFTVFDQNGNKVSFSSFTGKPIVLNFWASWCGPCKSEMPDLQSVYDAYQDDVYFLMVNSTDGARETKDTASKYIAGQGYTFPVFYDLEQSGAEAYGVNALPTTYVIDKEGYIAAYGKGPIQADALKNVLDQLK